MLQQLSVAEVLYQIQDAAKGIQTIRYRALRLCTTGIAKLQPLFTRQNGIIAEPSPRSQDSFFHILWEYPYQAGEMQYHLQYVRNLLV